MRRRSLIWALVTLLLLGGAAAPAPSGAAGGGTTGIDAVILIDQSGSMYGAGLRGAGNDPANHRIGQAKNIVYRLAEHVEGTSLVHRVAVIDFGTAASAAFPERLRLSYDPADPGAALRGAKTVAERYLTQKNLGDTNTPGAMALGLRQFEQMDASEPLPERRRVMLILTDGRPDLPGVKSLAALRDEVVSGADALKSREVGIWVVGLNDADNYWNEGDGAFWEKVAGAGRARLAETSSTSISALIQDIVNEWLGVRGLPIGKEYECPPYLRRVIFNINFGVPHSTVSVTDPRGVNVPLSTGGPASTPGTFARFIVEDPAPGTYRVNQDPSRSYTNFVEPFSPNLHRIAPAAKTSREAEALVVFRATDGRGEPLEVLPDWPIRASVLVTSPSGAAQELAATFEGDGKFQAKWKPSELGVHRVRLKGLVTLKGGSQFDVFGSDANAYDDRLEVDNSRPLWLEMSSPSPAAGFRVMPWGGSTRVEFSLLDSAKARVANPGGLVRDPQSWLALQVVDKSGVPLSDPVPLAPGDSGSFGADLPVRLDWKGGEGWWVPGELSLRVIAQPDRLGGEQFLDSVALPEGAEGLRVGGDPLSVGPLDVRYSWLALAPAALLPLAALLLLAWRLLPGGLVWWADSRRRRTVELKIYDGNDDPNGDYARRLPITARQSLNYDRKLTLQVDGEDVLAKKFRVRRDFSPDSVTATLEYSWQNDPDARTYTLMLVRGRPQRLKGLPSGDILASLDIHQ